MESPRRQVSRKITPIDASEGAGPSSVKKPTSSELLEMSKPRSIRQLVKLVAKVGATVGGLTLNAREHSKNDEERSKEQPQSEGKLMAVPGSFSDVKPSEWEDFLFRSLMSEVEDFRAAQQEFRQKSSDELEDETMRKLADVKDAGSLSIMVIAGDGRIQVNDICGVTAADPKQHWTVKSELLSYLFSRGFSDAIAECRSRGRAVIVLTNAERTLLSSKFSASVTPWKFCNLCMVGVWEKTVSAEEGGHLKHVQRLLHADGGEEIATHHHVIQCKPANVERPAQSTRSFNMVRSSKGE
jgi:hypothetical protein